jgi:tRNA (guanine-N(7)-)-methyltransferase subunit TRM82
MPIDISQDKTEYLSDAKKRPPVMGHVSMLTDFWILPSGDTIVTCDRDEHIRLSRWPEAYDIIEYLFGHTKYICFVFKSVLTTLQSRRCTLTSVKQQVTLSRS